MAAYPNVKFPPMGHVGYTGRFLSTIDGPRTRATEGPAVFVARFLALQEPFTFVGCLLFSSTGTFQHLIQSKNSKSNLFRRHPFSWEVMGSKPGEGINMDFGHLDVHFLAEKPSPC